MVLCTKIEIQNNCYSNNPNIVSVNTNNVPFVNNDASYAFYNCNAIKNAYNLNPNITNMSHAFEITVQGNTYISLYGNNVILPSSLQDASHMFRNRCTWVNSHITLPSSITNAYKMFDACFHLKNTYGEMTHCANMCSMYAWSYNITNNAFNLANYTASQAEDIDMSEMFRNCSALTYARPLPANVTNLAYTFLNTNLITNLTIPNKVINMCGCFKNSHVTTVATLPDSVEDISYCYNGCSYITSTSVTIPSNVINASYAFCPGNNIATINFQSNKLVDISHIKTNFWNSYTYNKLQNVVGFFPDTLRNMCYAFANEKQLVNFMGSTTANGFHFPSDVEDISCCFDICSNLSGNFYLPANLINGYQAFYNCAYSVKHFYGTLNKVDNLGQTFYNCNNTTFDLNIAVNNLKTIRGCFSNIRYWNGAGVNFIGTASNDITTDASYLFDNCYSLQQVPTGFSNIRCTNLAGAFSYCSNLSGNIYIGSDSVSNATGCFNGTSLPKNVYIPFTYANGVNTQTYNTFNAIYGTGANGVTLLNYTALYE